MENVEHKRKRGRIEKDEEDEWGDRESKERERAAEEERGLAGLPVPPVSWDYLLLQSTVAQQKQREQQNYTHLPAQLFLHCLMCPTAVYLASMFITNITPMVVFSLFLVIQLKKKSSNYGGTALQKCKKHMHSFKQAGRHIITHEHLFGSAKRNIM